MNEQEVKRNKQEEKRKKWPIIAFIISLLFNLISLGFNIYQYNNGNNESRKFNSFRKKSFYKQTKLLTNIKEIYANNLELMSIINNFADKLDKCDLSKSDRKETEENLNKANQISLYPAEKGCISKYPKPKISGDCFEEPCKWIASNDEMKIKDGQYGAIALNDGSFSYIQRCGSIIYAIEKDKRGAPPTTETLNKYRIPEELVNIFHFKKVATNVWVLEHI